MTLSEARARLVELERYLDDAAIRLAVARACPRGEANATADELATAVRALERNLGGRVARGPGRGLVRCRTPRCYARCDPRRGYCATCWAERSAAGRHAARLARDAIVQAALARPFSGTVVEKATEAYRALAARLGWKEGAG